MTLYELTGDFLRLYQMADEGELSQDAINGTLEGLEYELEDKADAYAKVIRSLEGDMASLKAEIDRLTARKRTMENNITAMKQSLEMAMRVADRPKFKTRLFSFGIQKNPPSLKIDDPCKVPKEYVIPQEPKYDSAGIKKFLKGLDESDVCEWAHLEQSESLRIR